METPHETAVYIGHRKVCPACANHPQGEPQKVHDCKTVFIDEKGEVRGQCCCWSEIHGKRD
jgi:hypothetical protein